MVPEREGKKSGSEDSRGCRLSPRTIPLPVERIRPTFIAVVLLAPHGTARGRPIRIKSSTNITGRKIEKKTPLATCTGKENMPDGLQAGGDAVPRGKVDSSKQDHKLTRSAGRNSTRSLQRGKPYRMGGGIEISSTRGESQKDQHEEPLGWGGGFGVRRLIATDSLNIAQWGLDECS